MTSKWMSATRVATALASMLAVLALTLAVLTLLAVPAARAADPSFCRGYATAALNQVRGGLANPRCAVGMQGPRWSSEFNVHYEWCLKTSFTATGAERDARTGYLKACR